MSASVKEAVATAARLSGAGRWIARRRFADSIAIAMYHGLSRERLTVPEWCFLDEQSFAAQMRYLARHFTVVHVEEAATVAATQPRRPVASITFDDGFASVHDLAWPILASLGLPATIYVVTGLIDSDDTVWFARLHDAITRTSVTSVQLDGVVHPLGSAAEKAAASGALQRALKRFDATEFDGRLDALVEQLHVEPVVAASVDHLRMLTSAQIRAMAADDLIRFGGHTVHHQILTRVPSTTAADEIERSVVAMGEVCGRSTTSFAYPNGGPDDYDDGSVDTLRRLGVPFAVTTSYGPNRPSSDPLRLLRYGIGSDDSLGTFAWRMHHLPSKLAALRGRARAGT